MPYIKKEDRENIVTTSKELEINGFTRRLKDSPKVDISEIKTAGELQYAMAVMFKSYIERKGLNYQNCNDIMGALAGAQMEFYRRVVAPYEDEKIKINGDV